MGPDDGDDAIQVHWLESSGPGLSTIITRPACFCSQVICVLHPIYWIIAAAIFCQCAHRKELASGIQTGAMYVVMPAGSVRLDEDHQVMIDYRSRRIHGRTHRSKAAKASFKFGKRKLLHKTVSVRRSVKL
jgi:hypothetical protein